MVSTSARNAGGPWFDSRSRHDRFCTLILFVYVIHCIVLFSLSLSLSLSLYIYIYIYIYIYYTVNCPVPGHFFFEVVSR